MTDTQSPSAPLFSVITVTYNAEDTLPATLASVRSQTFGSFEHIIVDGASRDRTIALAQENAPACQILVSGPDRGLYDAMNKGLGMARGEYVVFLNAGDTFHSSSTLADVADAVMANDFPGVVYGQTDLVAAGDPTWRRRTPPHRRTPSDGSVRTDIRQFPRRHGGLPPGFLCPAPHRRIL